MILFMLLQADSKPKVNGCNGLRRAVFIA